MMSREVTIANAVANRARASGIWKRQVSEAVTAHAFFLAGKNEQVPVAKRMMMRMRTHHRIGPTNNSGRVGEGGREGTAGANFSKINVGDGGSNYSTLSQSGPNVVSHLSGVLQPAKSRLANTQEPKSTKS